MAVANFHKPHDPTAHENFVRWCAENPTGFFVNVHAKGPLLHRVGCWHTAPEHERWSDLPDNRKVCASDEDELVEHFRREHGAPPARCSHC